MKAQFTARARTNSYANLCITYVRVQLHTREVYPSGAVVRSACRTSFAESVASRERQQRLGMGSAQYAYASLGARSGIRRVFYRFIVRCDRALTLRGPSDFRRFFPAQPVRENSGRFRTMYRAQFMAFVAIFQHLWAEPKKRGGNSSDRNGIKRGGAKRDVGLIWKLP